MNKWFTHSALRGFTIIVAATGFARSGAAAWAQDPAPPAAIPVPSATAAVPVQAAVAAVPATEVTRDIQSSRVYKHVPDDRRLTTRVTIKLSDVDLEGVVSRLKQTGTYIRVEEGLKPGRRFTLYANNVPVGKVLEAIALQANLVVCPWQEGVLLEKCPEMTVNGKTYFFQPSNMPWSDEWDRINGALPTGDQPALSPTTAPLPAAATVAPISTVEPPVPVGVQVPATAVPAPWMNGAYPGIPRPMQYIPNDAFVSPPANIRESTILVTALSEHSFVVSESGAGPHNEPGFYLTVYHLMGAGTKAGEKLVAGPRVFHKSSTSPAAVSLDDLNRAYYPYWARANTALPLHVSPPTPGSPGGGPMTPAAPTVAPVPTIGPIPASDTPKLPTGSRSSDKHPGN